MKDEENLSEKYFQNKNITVPIVIWWTPFTLDEGSFKKCNTESTCYFTNLRKFRNHKSSTKAFICNFLKIK